MKKLNATEAANIVGGTSKVCSDSYEKIIVGGVSSCKLITTCTDKHGNKTYQAQTADDAKCAGQIAP